MQRSSDGLSETLYDGLLMLGLAVALSIAWLFSYYGSLSARSAFAYQTAVVATQRDAALLRDEADGQQNRPAVVALRKALTADLRRITAIAQVPEERSPAFAFPATAQDYNRLSYDLNALFLRGTLRFDRTVKQNLETRDLSLGLFALLCVLFVAIRASLRRRVEEGRALVDRLQRAFMSRHRDLPNIEVGTILLSATRGSNIGGDLYDIYSGTEGYGYLLMADVSGKGIDAAVDTAFVKYTIRTLFSETQDPGRILGNFSALYAQTIENPESFVVVFLAVVDLRSGAITYASAGHEPAFVRRPQAVTRLEATGPIVGIDANATYGTHELMLAKDDYLVLATDGLTEARDPKGALLGTEGVAVWLSELDGSAQYVADQLIRRLRRRSRDRILDDLAVLVARVIQDAPP